MLHSLIPHQKASLGKEEEQAALRVLHSGHLSPGLEVKNFENEFCKMMDLPMGHALAVSSGSAAMYLALWALDARNKKIALPTYVSSSSLNSIHLAGGRSEIIDIDRDSPNMNIEQLKYSQSSIAIIPHMYGIPCDFSSISRKMIIEDCTHAIGAKIKKQSVGLFGEIGVFSFYTTKLMTTGGQGGMVISKKKKYVDAMRDYIYFDMKNDAKKRFNFQMTEIQAAIGREQLKKLPHFIKRREEIYQQYLNAGLDLVGKDLPNSKFDPIRYRAIVKTSQVEKIIARLEKVKIQAIVPLDIKELIGNPKKFPQASQLCKQSVSLPLYPDLSKTQVQQIIHAIEAPAKK